MKDYKIKIYQMFQLIFSGFIFGIAFFIWKMSYFDLLMNALIVSQLLVIGLINIPHNLEEVK